MGLARIRLVLSCVVAAIASTALLEAGPSQASGAQRSLADLMAAGETMAFDVASVKPDRSDASASSLFPLGPGDAYTAGGLFSARNQPAIVYVRFAFKLGQSDLMDLPPWVYDERFDIEARASGTPTKDQMRLMMQSLLKDRFHMRTHIEAQTKPVFNLQLVTTGKTGPQLRPHASSDSCGEPSTWLPPIACGALGPTPPRGQESAALAGRRVTMARFADLLMNPFTGIDRPVIDRTGLRGEFDLSVEWSPPPESAKARDARVEDTTSTFLQALREQLGLKLQPAKGLVNVIEVDHIEHPAAD